MAVNAPEPGTIKEFLVKEEDTVTVGQDLLKLELGGTPKSGDKQAGGSEPKAPAPDEQSTTSDPEPNKDEPSKEEPEPKKESPPPTPEPKKEAEPSKQESRPSQKQDEPPRSESQAPKSKGQKAGDSKPTESSPFGSREERRVCLPIVPSNEISTEKRAGQNEPYATPHCRAAKAVPEHCSLVDYLQ